MDASELDPEFTESVLPVRALRGIALIGVSTIAIAAAAIAYVNPHLPSLGPQTPAAAQPAGAYRITAIDFVDPMTGWIVADYDTGGYSVLHTDDGGATWTRQLSGSATGRGHYLKFFDSTMGLAGLLGAAPELYRTMDGGVTWTRLQGPAAKGSVLSWSFVEFDYGWALVSGTTAQAPLPAYLYRTTDGANSWQNLGEPAPSPDQAFEANFTYLTTGWLSSANGGPYAYKTEDYGQSWTRVPLPAPAGGWPHGGTFLVAMQPTADAGVAASVVFFPTLQGRKGQGATIQDFPPLTVGVFDGGRPVTYSYAVAIASGLTMPAALANPPNQTELVTRDGGATWKTITTPPANGALGFQDAADWWWVGAGRLATSGDGGATWNVASTVKVQQPLPGSLQILDRLHAWLVAYTGSRSVLETTNDGGKNWRLVSLPS